MVNVPLAPVVIGIVLGPIFEESLRQGLIINDGNITKFFSFNHPIALILIFTTLAIILKITYKELFDSLKNKESK
jgi:putative tricarboxylic transport membrane protein